MKILFLDFDGVLNSVKWMRENPDMANSMFLASVESKLDKNAVALLNDVLAKTGAYVVISSTWRKCMSLVEIKEVLYNNGFTGKVVGATPRFAKNGSSHRGDEIQEWLDTGYIDVEKFVIVDDNSDDMGRGTDESRSRQADRDA